MVEASSTDPEAPEALAGKRVLVVEDEANVRDAVSQLLTHEGCKVIMAADGSEAIAQARQASPDVIILDLGLPSADPGGAQFDGFEVMRWLDMRLPTRIPVVVLTARQDEATRRQAEALGASMFVAKPFKPLDLKVALRIAMSG
jgi:CheY-like chemotaxis protein